MAEAVVVRLGVEDELQILALLDRHISLNISDVRMRRVDTAVHHGHFHALTGAALPRPLRGDELDRVEWREGDQLGVDECRRIRRAQAYH